MNNCHDNDVSVTVNSIQISCQQWEHESKQIIKSDNSGKVVRTISKK